MTPQELIAKWQRAALSERSAYQQHFLDLCDLLLDLEKEVIAYGAGRGVGMLPHVRPTQLAGIEINPYAQQLPQVVIWIGYLQCMHHKALQAASLHPGLAHSVEACYTYSTWCEGPLKGRSDGAPTRSTVWTYSIRIARCGRQEVSG